MKYDTTYAHELLSKLYPTATITRIPNKKQLKIVRNGTAMVYQIRERTGSLINADVDVTLRDERIGDEMYDANHGLLNGMVVIDGRGGYVIVNFEPLRERGFFGRRAKHYGKLVYNTRTGGRKWCYTLGAIMAHGGMESAHLV